MGLRLASKATALLGAAVLSVVAVGAASAKGIQSADIDGPGIAYPIPVVSALGELSTLTAVWEMTPSHLEPVALDDIAPTARLGPAYTVTWRIFTGVNETTALRQDVYPDAAGGPVVHTAPGQAIFDGVTSGGWHRAPGALRELLLRLGVPSRGVRAPLAVHDRCTGALAGVGAALLASVVAVDGTSRPQRHAG